MTSLLPPNASPLEQALEQAVQQPPLPVPLRDLWNPETCPLEFLPWLAWGLSIDIWDPTWSEAEKRARTASAIEDQKHKGSRASVQKELDALGGHIVLTEWFEQDPPADPYTFTLDLSVDDPASPKTAAYIDQVLARIDPIKPRRAHSTTRQILTAHGAIGVDAAARPALFVRLEAVAPPKEFVYLTGADGARLINATGNKIVEA